MAKISVELEVTPTSGDPTRKTVEVEARGATVADVLEAAGVSADKQDLYVNGKVATPETFVADGEKLKLSEKPKVRVAERPSGS